MSRFLILAALSIFAATGCHRGEQIGNNEISQQEIDDAWRKQNAEYDRQTGEMDKLMERQQRQLDKAEADSERYAKILTKWEEQSRRADAILEAFEKKVGPIEPPPAE